MQLLVRSIQTEAEDILSLELVSPQGEPLPAFTAGAHIDLHLGNGCKRSYSLANAPSERHRYVVAVHNAPNSRGGSRYIHEQLRAGTQLEVTGPRNNFELVENAPLVVFFAGGIGITPLWSMIQRLEALGRPWQLHYGSRSRCKSAYLKDIEALGAKYPGRVNVHIDEQAGNAPMDLPALMAKVPVEAHVYCCGPTPMLAAFEKAAASRGPESVHLEYFGAAQAAAVAGGFQGVMPRSNRSVRVEPGKSILGALLDAGADIAHACCEGVCGACQTKVIEGAPDHRDSYLTAQEKNSGKSIIVCCSGSKSDVLVLDV